MTHYQSSMAEKTLVILISGRGSNMEALLDAKLPARVAAVISNNPQAKGLATAQRRGVETAVVDHREFPDRTAFDAALAAQVDKHRPDLVALAGFMRVLTEPFIEHYRGRMMNIHPSLLPSFPGLDPHGQALRAGVKISGATVHFVSPETDAGPIIAQAAVPVREDDNVETLAARVLAAEHRVYPLALARLASGRIKIVGARCLIEGVDQAVDELMVPAR